MSRRPEPSSSVVRTLGDTKFSATSLTAATGFSSAPKAPRATRQIEENVARRKEWKKLQDFTGGSVARARRMTSPVARRIFSIHRWRRLRLPAQPYQPDQTQQQAAAHRPCAAVFVPGKKGQGGRANGGAGKIFRANRRLMKTAMLALGLAHVHGIIERRIINQAQREAERELGGDEHGEVRGE